MYTNTCGRRASKWQLRQYIKILQNAAKVISRGKFISVNSSNNQETIK